MTVATASRNETNPGSINHARALIVNLYPAASDEISDILRGAGFAVETTTYGEHTPVRIVDAQPQLVLLLLSSATEDGLEACREIRGASDAALVICCGSDDEIDIIHGLEAGADDYLALPARPAEIVARLQALLRRLCPPSAEVPADRLIAGDLEIRLDEHKAVYKGRPIHLTPTQFRLLVSLVRESGRVVTHSRLLAQAWGPQYVDSRNYVRLYIQYLRSKIEEDPRHPRFILSERGVGYRFEMSPAQVAP